MRLTKHEHAALVVVESGHTLVIDPGSFTSPLEDLVGLVGVVITHEHPDHWTPEHLTRLQKAHPTCRSTAPRAFATPLPGSR